MDADKVKEVLAASGESAFRLRQVLKAVYAGASSYAQVTELPAGLRQILERDAPILSVWSKTLLISKDGRALKAVLALGDGFLIETVLLKPVPGPDWTACISVQVGCAMGCTFCATGLMGLKRNLRAEEITDQVLFWRQRFKSGDVRGALTNLVYMGMGEPFHNYDAVAGSLRQLVDPGRFGMSPRHISVSTVGLAPGMDRFAEEFPQVNLALSLHAVSDSLRSRLVPANKAYPVAELGKSLKRILASRRRKIFLEYVLLAGENDGLERASELVRFVRSVGRPDLLHVNLIVWNPTDTPHQPSDQARARAFRDFLKAGGLSVTIRKNLGQDISGACGQLVTAEAA